MILTNLTLQTRITSLLALAILSYFLPKVTSITFSTSWITASLVLLAGFQFYQKYSFNSPVFKILTAIVCVLFSALFAIHTFDSPSFFILEYQFSNHAENVPIYYNFDKLILGLIILFCGIKFRETKKPLFSINWVLVSFVFVLSCCIIFILAMELKLVAFEPKQIPMFVSIIWALKNLILVSFGEELLFRGFIQQELNKWHKTASWLITSGLFGLAHLPAGFAFASIATLAGMLYGWIYLKTQNIWLTVLAHFCFNLMHLYLFTYPSLFK